MLSGDERNLVVELLEHERRDLPAEIRRTEHPAYHHELLERMKLVDALLGRLHRESSGALTCATQLEI
jgi:hypothetical protein